MGRSATERVTDYLKAQSQLDVLRFITCGSVDDGKSTLIGRMLYEAKLIFEDQVASLQAESKVSGTQGGDIDFALLVDGLAAEREQGITIDVAYRFFSTERRKFIVADTPGHEQYTRNMVTGASTADVAVILIDARQGVLTQTRRHSLICSVLGIRHVLLAVNKMDLVGYDQSTFQAIVEDYTQFAEALEFESITPIPLSALKGDNVVSASDEMAWFDGPTLISYLETVETKTALTDHPLRYPVQWVNRPNLDFRGFSGTVAAGQAKRGQSIRVLPSGETASIQDIVLFGESLEVAETDRAVTMTLDREVDVSRGSVIVASESPCEVADQFEVDLVWMDADPGYVSRGYLLQLATLQVTAQLTDIKYRLNVNTFEKLAATKLGMNDLAVVTVKTDRPIPFESYRDCPALGSFILIDRVSNQTVAAGMIRHALRRSTNIHHHKMAIDRETRERLNGHQGKVLWFTGLSGSGKSTIASALETRLHERGIRTYILDGDNVRHGLNSDLGFTDADRIENIRRVSEVAKLMVDAGLVVLTAFISPFRAEREMARALFESSQFVEVFVDAPLEVAEARDPKGLYKKARAGDIPNFTGIGSPYEPPEDPDIRLDAGTESVDALVEQILEQLDF